MGDVLVYMEPTADERLLAWARPLAQATGGDLIALVAGDDAPSAEAIAPADVVLEITHPALAHYTPEAHRAVLVAAVREREPDLVICVNTTAGFDLAPAVAAVTGRPFVGYCVGLTVSDGEVEAASSVYGGALVATTRTPLPAVVEVSAGALHPEPATAGRGDRATLDPPAELDHLATTFVEAVAPPDDGIDLTKAEVIVCVGRGIGDADSVVVAQELADALGAEIGASRPVVDSGWLPRARQIGQSGTRVKPKVYLGLGVSGAPEHLEGIQEAEMIIAVNHDPGAAIFRVADYGVVADLFDIAEELTAQVGQAVG
jgi:electron transfer flavoprotein alpha subunit